MNRVTVLLSIPSTLAGVPQWATTGANGALPISARLVTPTTLELTYPLIQAAGALLTVPSIDSSVRGYTGGYVVAVVLTLV